jgi:chromosome segregation ATPase
LQALLEDLQVRFQATERQLRDTETKFEREKKHNASLLSDHVNLETILKQEKRIMERQLKELNVAAKINKQVTESMKLRDGEEGKLRMALATALKEKSLLAESIECMKNNMKRNDDLHLQQIDVAATKISELEELMNGLKTELAEASANVDHLNSKITSAEIAQQRAEFQQQNVQEDLDNLQIIYERCLTELKTTKNDLEQSVTLNEDIANQLEATSQMSNASVDLIEQEKKKTIVAIARVGALEGQLEVSKDKYTEEIIKMESIARSMEREGQVTKNNLKDAILQMSIYEHQMSDMQNEIETLKNKVSMVSTKHVYNETKAQLDVLVSQIGQLEVSLSERNAEITKYQMHERTLTSEMKQLEAAVESMESETAAAHTHTTEAVTEAVEEREKMRSIVKNMNDMVEEKDKEIMILKEESTNKLADTLRNLGKVKDELEQTTRALEVANCTQNVSMHEEQLKQENNKLLEKIREGERKQLLLHTDIEKLQQQLLNMNDNNNTPPAAPQASANTKPRKKMPFGALSGNQMGGLISELKTKLKSKKKGQEKKISANTMMMSRPITSKNSKKKKPTLQPFQDEVETF